MADASASGRATRSRGKGLAFVVAASVLFAVNGTVSKAALLAGLAPLQMTQIRVTGTFVILLAVVALVRPRALRVARHEWLLLILYGLVGIVVVQTFYFIAIGRLPVGIALLIEYTAPLFVALWARFGQHRAVPRRFWLALALAFFGLTLVAQVWTGGGELDAVGVLAGFGAAVSLAVYFVVGEASIGDGGRDVVSFTMLGFGVASVAMALVQPWWNFPFALLGAKSAAIEGIPAVSVGVLVAWVVVLGTTVPYLLTLASLGHLTAAASSVASMLEPVLAGVFAWVLLGEALSSWQLIGAAVVLTGVIVAELSGAHPMANEATVPLDQSGVV